MSCLGNSNHKSCCGRRGEMFIAQGAENSSLAPEERNVALSEAKYFAPSELKSLLGSLGL